MKKNLFIILSAAALLVACQPADIKQSELFRGDALAVIAERDGANYILYDEAHGGLNQFVADYSTEEGNYKSDNTPYRTRANNESVNPGIWLFSIDTLPTNGPGIYIQGRVVTDDWGGNFYKAMVIQQMVNGKQQALRLSIDAGNISGMYTIGQEILIRVNGLAIGRYANQPQLCVPTMNNNIYASHADEKVGWAPGRIPIARFAKATTRIGRPNIAALHYDEMTINEFTTMLDVKAAREWDGLLVRIKDIYSTCQYADTYGNLKACSAGNPEDDTNANVFAPTTNNVGFPQGRVITDGTFNTLISTSEYAKYAHMYLPTQEYVGTVEGVLSFYMDNAKYTATWKTWSISMRDLKDLKLTNAEGKAWEPVEYSK